MATPSYTRSMVCAAKRLKISPQTSSIPIQHTQSRRAQIQTQQNSLPSKIKDEIAQLRLPRAVQATYLTPLKHTPSRPAHATTPTCNLQLRSYSIRNLETFADFALRAAYYLRLPASGPVPLPRKVERWTVLRSNFIFKKSQENFERRTYKRLIQIQDGDVETVGVWLAFLRKWQNAGVGLKADVFEHSGLDVSEMLDAEAERIAEVLGGKSDLVGAREGGIEEGELEEMMLKEPFKAQWGADAAMSANDSVAPANERIDREVVRAAEKS